MRLYGEDLFNKLREQSNKEIRTDNGVKYCLYCGKDLIGRRRKYCNDECYEKFYDEYNRRFVWEYIRQRILKRDNCICRDCRREFPAKQLEVHHIIPRCEGGDNSDINLVTLCKNCHKKVTKQMLKKRFSKNLPNKKQGKKIIALENYLK
ncbi:MAG: hypothetical protein GF317_05730 [Candidatus Lokiarchaeota archaeon]|nr:hypothetical protein [Candidatus Lokiarchaeota archaeon]